MTDSPWASLAIAEAVAHVHVVVERAVAAEDPGLAGSLIGA
jgi:hypothetical protein